MNMVIAGALSTLAPFKKSAWLKAMEESFTGRKAKLLEINVKAFELGRAAVPGAES
jgi:Pyruvate/2-oxoacid:ferredoxin oxidoreductase gamma subunit